MTPAVPNYDVTEPAMHDYDEKKPEIQNEEKKQEIKPELRAVTSRKPLPSFDEWIVKGNQLSELNLLSRKVSRVMEFSKILTNIDILQELKGLREDIKALGEVLKNKAPDTEEIKRTRGK